MSEIVEKLKQVSVRHLNLLLQDVLNGAEKGDVPNFDAAMDIRQHRDDILFSFVENMNGHFEELITGAKPRAVYNFETLSLVQDDDLDLLVALEGMVGAARNAQLPTFISFNTRLNSIVTSTEVDESSNPLDPAQIAESFKNAMQPVDLPPKKVLALYRYFNTMVLRKLDGVLAEANHLLIDQGVIPNLGMDGGRGTPAAARSTPRPAEATSGFGSVEEEPFEAAPENPELFSMMQNLLRPSTENANAQYAIPASMMPPDGKVLQPFAAAPGEEVHMVDQAQLMAILTNIQQSLEARATPEVDISSTLGEMLQETDEEGKVSAVDRQSSDIISLVTMLYEAIWADESVPIPIKELIGRTQITIIKVALSDTTFFNNEGHPARMVLNEFAEAGIGWIEVDEVEDDPLYKKIQELVQQICTKYDGDVSLFDDIIKEFREFRARIAARSRTLEQKILRAKESEERLEDIRELVTQKIAERILGRDLQEFVQEMLDGPFHKFMVMLVLKEGPGTNAWKQAINTIDVLLWTVQPHEDEGDRARLETVNPRLLNNLRKAFRIAQATHEDVDQLIQTLKEVQQESFIMPPAEPGEAEVAPQPAEVAVASEAVETPFVEPTDEVQEVHQTLQALTEDDPLVKQVDNLNVGLWVEFSGDDNVAIRCKLAARINAIDKYIFVNRQGVKVVEKTRMGLARELKDGTVKIISDGALFSRALESVIGNLREAQQEQHTASAYRPG